MIYLNFTSAKSSILSTLFRIISSKPDESLFEAVEAKTVVEVLVLTVLVLNVTVLVLVEKVVVLLAVLLGVVLFTVVDLTVELANLFGKIGRAHV